MTAFLYGRVSTVDQHTEIQEQALKARYPEGVYREEKKTGTTMAGREVLQLILDMIGRGDKLVVWKLDRLARNVADLSRIVAILEKKGAALEIIDQAIDTSTASGKAFLQMLGVFAEFETNLRKERQKAGIEKAKEAGKHLGRKAILTAKQREQIRVRREKGETPTMLAKEYGVSRATIYNVN